MIKLLGLFLALTLLPGNAHAAISDVDAMTIPNSSILVNGGFENGKAKWTASGGTFTTVTTGSTNLLTGKVSATWDSSASAQTLLSTAIAIPKGLYGRSGVARCKIQTPSGTATHLLQAYDGTNIISSAAVISSTIPTFTETYFTFPSTGNISLRIIAVNSNEPLIAVDDCFIGDAIGVTNVAQAAFAGSAYFATTASCSWARTNTALGGFTTTAACPGPTVDLNPGPGTIQTTDSDLPRVTINNLPPGTYEVIFSGIASSSTNFAGAQLGVFDGTTTSNMQGSFHGTNSGSGLAYVRAYFTYTNTGNRSFELYAASTTGAVTLDNSVGVNRLSFSIVRFPGSPEIGFKPDQSPSSWTGYHFSDCAWARTNVAYGDFTADTTCTFTERTNKNFGTVTSYLSGSDKLPGIVFTSKRAGAYLVCSNFIQHSGSTSYGYRLSEVVTSQVLAIAYNAQTSGQWSNSTLCGIFNAPNANVAYTIRIEGKSASGAVNVDSNTAAADETINWTIVSLDQSFPAPLIANSVVSPSNGVVKTMSAHIVGNATTPTISRQDGSWISSIARNGTGDYTLTLTAGTCSTVPNCTTGCKASGANTLCGHFLDCAAGGCTTRSTTTIRTQQNSASANSDASEGDIMCTCQP